MAYNFAVITFGPHGEEHLAWLPIGISIIHEVQLCGGPNSTIFEYHMHAADELQHQSLRNILRHKIRQVLLAVHLLQGQHPSGSQRL